MKRLNDKTDQQFDEAYCLLVIQTHKETIALFEKASSAAGDPDIQAWGMDTSGISEAYRSCVVFSGEYRKQKI